jgi:Rad3-related DNA helicase
MAGKKIWRHDHAYPSTVRDTRTLLAWLRSYYGTETNRTLKSLREQLEGEAPERWLVTRELQPYRGQERECLLLAPVDVTEEAARFFGQTVKKIVLLSATLSMHELHDLRLKGKRVVRLEAASAIPPEQRPILKEYIGTASYKNQEAYVASLCSWLLTQAPAGKGFVHMPYGWAHALAKQDGGANSRLLFHEAHNKAQVLANWRKSNPEQELILIACGMEEGIDLKGLEFSWQAIAKITWPSLQDVAIKHLVETRGDWFTWQAVKHVVQASGRICRAPDDFGVTLILDEQLEFLLERGRPLFPKSFLEAVQ